jgi:protein-tyrosine phosphatase
MAAALFTARIPGLTDSVEVSSAGVLDLGGAGPSPVPDEVLQVMAPYGIDLRAHRSRLLTPSMLATADLVVGMSRRHVQEAVLLAPSCWPQAFMLKELVRRGSLVGPRRPVQGIRSWIDAAHRERTRTSLVHRSTSDDVADPYGGSIEQYRATATELADLTGRLAALMWPAESRAVTG